MKSPETADVYADQAVCATSVRAVNKPRRRGFTVIELLVVASVSTVLLAMATPGLQESLQSARDRECTNRLKQIGLAMHNYHDVYNTFPPGWVSRRPQGEGHPSTGWTVSILPFVEQVSLYNALNLRDPVYEPAVKTPAALDNLHAMLKLPLGVYRCAAEPKGDTNPLRGGWGVSNFSGNYGSVPIPRWSGLTFFPGQTSAADNDSQPRPDGIFYVNSSTKLRDIVDGTSNTILVGERSVIGKGGIWPGPRSNFFESDVVSDGSEASTLNQSETGYSSRHQGGIHFLICDGSIRFIRSDIQSLQNNTFQRLCSRNDGQVIGEF